MTATAISALRADRDALLELGTGLTDADWAAASGCPGCAKRSVLQRRVVHVATSSKAEPLASTSTGMP